MSSETPAKTDRMTDIVLKPFRRTLVFCLQVLDPADESTLWSSPYGEVKEQWVTFDLGKDYPVGAVRLLAMANTTGPKQVYMYIHTRTCAMS